MDFGDLKDNKQIQEKLFNFHASVEQIEKIAEDANAIDFDKLKTEQKADYDLFIAYILNTTYWMYLRSRGIDPNQYQVKEQLNRVKDYMLKAKQVNNFVICLFLDVSTLCSRLANVR